MAYMRRRTDARYARNPPPVGRLRWGRRVLDGQSGFWTYERRLIEDEWGLLIDPRFGGYDVKDIREDGSIR